MSESEPDRRQLFLLQRAARAALVHVNQRLQVQVEVSVAQLATLSYLQRHPGCAMTALADLLDLNKSAVTGMIARLERAGLVRRDANPRDGRSSLLYPTPKGERMRERARPVFRAVMAEMNEGFSERERDVVLRFLNSVVQRFGSEAT
jgi:DNA-binding MarR family transcriptional regulator